MIITWFVYKVNWLLHQVNLYGSYLFRSLWTDAGCSFGLSLKISIQWDNPASVALFGRGSLERFHRFFSSDNHQLIPDYTFADRNLSSGCQHPHTYVSLTWLRQPFHYLTDRIQVWLSNDTAEPLSLWTHRVLYTPILSSFTVPALHVLSEAERLCCRYLYAIGDLPSYSSSFEELLKRGRFNTLCL